ncbi:twin-arginine translocase TatA/TatE family subunit [Neofamilia massiliensis]|uniref:Sec-independent protein translocase subunit TatA/TatB n=1 Tax=Neofamilia massiliensis TaxID=1673724 RepID=UPI0006BB82D0|nr:twin-arginine translocase TatA/TatE family subunit [Neofamilia massiliensis]
MGRLGIGELAIILVIVLIVFGPKKLPELAKSMGQAVKEFKKGQEDLEETLNQPAITKEEKTDGQVSEKIDQAQNNDK